MTLKTIVCFFKGHTVPKIKTDYAGGDAYDQFGYCDRCENLCHRDNHIYSDGIWRIESVNKG